MAVKTVYRIVDTACFRRGSCGKLFYQLHIAFYIFVGNFLVPVFCKSENTAHF